ncbi:hypothetical protein GIB67_040115 [Kingdonia uniflora]|uniref:DEAD-box RNA helicase Q domain-containing protein n=1 Tax=Kingdonia uniflora TaxID=39325 RepID=A0A7J7MUJ5_9MAGN|nr:hypothetical protein GIB67_040115 [Kingdonia uniflora]
MVGLAPKGSQFDARQYDSKMKELLEVDGQEFFTTFEEVHDCFDAMGLKENLLRGIYAYGFEKPSAIQQRGIVPFSKGHDAMELKENFLGPDAMELKENFLRGIYANGFEPLATAQELFPKSDGQKIKDELYFLDSGKGLHHISSGTRGRGSIPKKCVGESRRIAHLGRTALGSRSRQKYYTREKRKWP